MTPGTLNLRIQRWAPYVETIRFVGFDFSAATLAMQFRLYRDAAGDPLIDLTNAAANAQGLSVTLTTEDGIPVSTVQIRINETTVEGLPFGGKAGADFQTYYDLVVTGGGLPKTRIIQGTATIEAGVTQ